MPSSPAASVAANARYEIRVRARRAALDAQRRAVADDAESRGAVVVAPGDPGRRERARRRSACTTTDTARRTGRARGCAPSSRRGTSGRAASTRSGRAIVAFEQRLAVRVPEAHVDVAARARVALVPLRHERHGVPAAARRSPSPRACRSSGGRPSPAARRSAGRSPAVPVPTRPSTTRPARPSARDAGGSRR